MNTLLAFGFHGFHGGHGAGDMVFGLAALAVIAGVILLARSEKNEDKKS